MRWGQIGGMLMIGGSVLVLPGAALAGPAALGDVGRDVAELVTNALLALLGSGAGVLGVFGPRPLHGRIVRIGLRTAAVGLLSLLVASIIPIDPGSNELQSGPWVISAILGLLATVVGVLITVLSLARASGASKVVGRLFLGGLFVALVFSILGNGAIALGSFLVVAQFLAALGGVAIVLAVATLGLVAIRGDRAAPDAAAWTTLHSSGPRAVANSPTRPA